MCTIGQWTLIRSSKTGICTGQHHAKYVQKCQIYIRYFMLCLWHEVYVYSYLVTNLLQLEHAFLSLLNKILLDNTISRHEPIISS